MAEGITFSADYGAIQKILEEYIASEPKILAVVDDMAKTVFQRSKSAMLREFEEHLVTQELKAGPGPEADNISNTLNGQKGNLYSFLGFDILGNQDPTQKLRETLEKDTTIRKSTRRGTVFYYRVYYPDKDEIVGASRMDWGSGVSWAYAVETGDFGGDAHLSHYIYNTWGAGRSSAGIQTKGVYSENDFAPIPYISEIIAKFIERMNELSL